VLYYERKFKRQGFDRIIGVDEVGRGPLAGPVVAGAVALTDYRFKNRIDDSKKLSATQREKAFGEIIAKSVFGIGIVNEKIIDAVNIYRATANAMEEAVSVLLNKLSGWEKEKNFVIVDGRLKLDLALPYQCIIKGDTKSLSIACASIVAKVLRDRIMDLYDALFPQYGFLRHKGYPTQRHRTALAKFGPSEIHRMSFNGVQR